MVYLDERRIKGGSRQGHDTGHDSCTRRLRARHRVCCRDGPGQAHPVSAIAAHGSADDGRDVVGAACLDAIPNPADGPPASHAVRATPDGRLALREGEHEGPAGSRRHPVRGRARGRVSRRTQGAGRVEAPAPVGWRRDGGARRRAGPTGRGVTGARRRAACLGVPAGLTGRAFDHGDGAARGGCEG